MKYRNRFLLILLVGFLVVPTTFGICDSIFPEELQPESVVEKPLYKIYVKFGNIVGESMQKDHIGWCESEAFANEVMREYGTQVQQGFFKPPMNPFEITKFLDRATPQLNEAAIQGKIFPLIKVDIVSSGESESLFMQYLFYNAVVTSVSINGDLMDGPPLPMEKVQFYCEQMTWRYIKLDYGKPGGTVEFSWKFEVETKEPVDVGLHDSNPQTNQIKEAQIDISGKWLSSVGSVFIIKQQGDQFSWTIEGLNKPATGQINGNKLNATWKEKSGTVSAKGEITKVDPKGKATLIIWDNDIVFHRD